VEESAAPRDKNILIVDDDEGIRVVLAHVLEKEGFQVRQAVNGEDVLRAVRDKPADLIILDLMIPRYGGFEILRHLQKEGFAKIPIIVITGRYSDRSIAELIMQESNVADFMEKPLKLPALLGAVHRVLKTKPGSAANS